MNDPTQATRRCRSCGEVKPIIGGFYRPQRKRSQCRECFRKWFREYTRERREFLVDYKMSRGCLDCGYADHVAALEFDHRPGEVKLFEPNELLTRGTDQQMMDEIAKCDVVCANCHRIRTHSRPPAMRLHDLRDKAADEVVRGYRIPVDPDQLGLFDESA